jgi:hypothetical protein
VVLNDVHLGVQPVKRGFESQAGARAWIQAEMAKPAPQNAWTTDGVITYTVAGRRVREGGGPLVVGTRTPVHTDFVVTGTLVRPTKKTHPTTGWLFFGMASS